MKHSQCVYNGFGEFVIAFVFVTIFIDKSVAAFFNFAVVIYHVIDVDKDLHPVGVDVGNRVSGAVDIGGDAEVFFGHRVDGHEAACGWGVVAGVEVVEVGAAEGVVFFAPILVGVDGYGGGGWRLQFYQAGDMWQAVGVVAVALGDGATDHDSHDIALIVVEPCVEFAALQVAVGGQDLVELSVEVDAFADIVGRVGGGQPACRRYVRLHARMDDAVLDTRRVAARL
ncbi:MAG: hypothetical protein OSJ46_06660 [Duncaniella sp.]|nr:hypothetical protein [Duncaniella sp.]